MPDPDYPTRDILQLGLTEGDPGAASLLASRMAKTTAEATPINMFNLKLMDLLKQYQQLGTRPFEERALGLEEEQVERIMREAEPGMPPRFQRYVREAEAGALEPSIAGARAGARTFAEQLRGFGDVLEQSRAIVAQMQQSEEQARRNARDLIRDAFAYLGGSAFEGMDPKELEQLEKTAGYPKGFLTDVGQTVKERELAEEAKWRQQQLALQQAQLSLKQQEFMMKYGFTLGEGTEAQRLKQVVSSLPVGQQDMAWGAIGSFKNARDIINLLDQGVKTGPVEGAAQRAATLTETGAEAYPLFNQFLAASTAFTANYIKAISGVQVSDKERKFLMKALPSEFTQEAKNRENLKMLLKFLKNKWESQLGINFDEFPTEIPQIEQPVKRIYKLRNPRTGEEATFRLTPEDYQDAIAQGFVPVE